MEETERITFNEIKENQNLFKSIEDYNSWIKAVITSLSAFLGVLFVFGGKLENQPDDSRIFGLLCLSIAVSIAAGFLILSRIPNITLHFSSLKTMEQSEHIRKMIKQLGRKIAIWEGFLGLTFILLIWAIIDKFLL